MSSERIGIFENIPYEEYAADPGLNGSKLMHMRRSPMKYRHERDNPTAASPVMEMGSLVHRMILEPELVGSIAVWGEEEDQKVRRGKVWNEFRKQNEGCIILTISQRNEAVGMSTAALNNAPIYTYARAEGPTELSMFWRHPVTKRRYKARLDKLIPDTHTIFDLKTTRDCHSYRFGGQAYSLGYHVKMALYAQGYEILVGKRPQVRLGALDSKAPHECAVYRVTDDVLYQGNDELNALVAKLDDCEKSGRWPAEYDEETDLVLPAWAMSSEVEVEDTM